MASDAIRGEENRGAKLPVRSLTSAMGQGSGASGSNSTSSIDAIMGQGGKRKKKAPGQKSLRSYMGQ